ncbi:hypothetical protein BOTCAL_0120g00120 [Botryotinia calthae]|uniref:Uncharacterized protein n=1 Tax=Botryotinia calthae TaxID=38488 RepID=A0A4Y8D6W8_9HELO|nr:hypothetical protein BOTCAL_0120g00120 [Botryotinia calthae]
MLVDMITRRNFDMKISPGPRDYSPNLSVKAVADKAMDHFVLTFRPKALLLTPQRQVSNAFQPRLPTINEYATLAVGTSTRIKHPLSTPNLDGANYGAPACPIDSTDAILPSTSLSPPGFTKPLSGQPISVRIPNKNAVCTSWCEHTTQYRTYDPTIGMQVLPIPIDLLAEFIIEEAIKADNPLQKLAHICLVKYDCYEKESRKSEVARLVRGLIQRDLH